MQETWRRWIGRACFVIVAVVGWICWMNLSSSELRFQYERHRRIVAEIHALDCQLDSYKKANGSYPTTLSALEDVPKDPWDQDYVYRFPGIHNRDDYDLFSAGADRKPDTADDDWGD